MNPIDKKIFVVGTGRCGTTWIGTWLRQHPLTFGGPETHIFRILSSLLNPNWNQGIRMWANTEKNLTAIRSFVLESLGACKFRQEDQIHLIEHSACHYDEIDFISELFPDAYFIHPYRDIRNVIESKVRINLDAEESLDNWIKIMTDMRNRKSEHIFHIKYESIVATPELSRSITEFVGIEHHKDIDSWEFPVNTSSFAFDPDRWKNLPPETIRMIEESTEAQELMAELKYDFPEQE